MEPILAVAIIGAAVFIGFYLQSPRSESLIRQWAQDNGYTLLEAQPRVLRRGPFFLTMNRDQTVYYVSVEDSDGATRWAWVRCGGWLLGLLSDQIEAVWDD